MGTGMVSSSANTLPARDYNEVGVEHRTTKNFSLSCFVLILETGMERKDKNTEKYYVYHSIQVAFIFPESIPVPRQIR